MMIDYATFLERKAQLGQDNGFDPVWMPAFLFDFQQSLVEWALRKGRAAIFADCGLGKTPMLLVWAENVARHTGRPVLILTPLAVGPQTVAEGKKFGIPVVRSRDGTVPDDDARLIVTNYEQLHHFDPSLFAGVVCDESSILKHFSGATQKAVTRFMLKVPYRLLCTATAAPNDYIELGTSSEALGELGYTDMLSRFFKQSDKQPHRMEEIKQWEKMKGQQLGGNHFGKLSFRIAQQIGQWRLKGHAVTPFWRWVASWARAVRKPSDLGFDDARFVLPELIEREHIVEPQRPPDGMLFTLPAFGLKEEREERRRTLQERCQRVADLVAPDTGCSLVWCHLNAEGDLLERLIPGAVQVRGADTDDYKEFAIDWFVGRICICEHPLFNRHKAGRRCECGHRTGRRVLVSKAVMFGWGLNLQHCNHIVTFATHSFESYYQSIRRCWRFGQERPVTVDIVATVGEQRVLANLHRKQEAADHMFTELVSHMTDAMRLSLDRNDTQPVEVPAWA